GHQEPAAGQAAQDLGASPAVAVGADQPEHDAEQAGRGQDDPDRVQAAGPGTALARQQQQWQHRDADGDVDPEDPLPGRGVGDRPADDRAQGRAETYGGAPQAQRHAAALRRGDAG